MRRWSSSFVSQFLVVGFVAGAVPFAAAHSDTPDESAHLTVLTAAPSSADLAAEHRYLELAEAGVQDEPSRTAEEAAIALADSLGAVPVSDLEGSATCPTAKLTVSWSEPGPEYLHGAFVTPLGPAPGPDTDEVNGVVLCEGYPYAFMGFEAERTGAAWDVVAVPYLGADDGHEPANDDADAHEDHDEEPADEHEHEEEKPAPSTPRIDVPVADLGPIEGYAAYEPQRICHATAKPGTDALRRLLTGHYPSTRNLGIVRGCSIGGRSEHKEGRAFDWGAYAHREVERRSADDLIGRLLATDEAGNRHALARRMGVMYIIWNQRIWSAYRYDAGWRPYSGRSPHTDHVHISLSWDGAMARTSFWNANGVEALLGTPAGTTIAAAKPVEGAPAPADDRAHAGHDDRHVTDGATEEARAEREERREEYERRLQEWREARERRREEREARRAAGRPIDRESESEVAAREAEEAAEQALEALEEADEDAERAERRARREADRAARRAEWEAERERRQQVREEREAERAERRAERDAERERRHQEREQRRAEERAAREQRETERQSERESEREQRRQEREERQAEKERQREERRQQREAERSERAAQKQQERERRRQEREERRAEKERRREEERERRRQEREERQAEKERRREERRRQQEEAPPAPVEEAPAPEPETSDA